MIQINEHHHARLGGYARQRDEADRDGDGHVVA